MPDRSFEAWARAWLLSGVNIDPQAWQLACACFLLFPSGSMWATPTYFSDRLGIPERTYWRWRAKAIEAGLLVPTGVRVPVNATQADGRAHKGIEVLTIGWPAK